MKAPARTRALRAAAIGAILFTGAGAQAQSLQVQREALNLIADFADRFCKDVPLTGSEAKVAVGASVMADLLGLFKKIAGLGVSGAAEYQQQRYQGLLQADLVRALESGFKCRMLVWTDLNNRLLSGSSPSPAPGGSRPPDAAGRPELSPDVKAAGWELVATEDFAAPTPGWPGGSWQDSASEGTVSHENGVIRVDARFNSGYVRSFDVPYPASVNIRMTMDVRIVRADTYDDFAGLLFARARGSELHYPLQRNGFYALWQQTDGGPSFRHVLDWIRSGAITGEWNRMEVEAIDQTITLRLNGALAAVYRDVNYGGGTVGFLVGSRIGGTVSIEFDNFALYRRRPNAQ